jgi:hypothetical protein
VGEGRLARKMPPGNRATRIMVRLAETGEKPR